jgi:hypothetical protein
MHRAAKKGYCHLSVAGGPRMRVGLHDLHRIYWGADAYIRNGSHGCVNLPLGDAAVLYNEFCYVGIPVITYGGLKNIG